MSAIDDFLNLLETTEAMKQVLRSLKEEPAHLLRNVCQEYQRTGQPVPDHNLQLLGYMGEAALSALIAAGLIKQQHGGRLSLYTYEPASEGREQYEKLRTDGFYGDKP